MRRLLLAGMVAAACGAAGAQEKALPGVEELRAKSRASYKASEAARERYLCRERITGDDVDSKGRLKKSQTVEQEIFFVKGVEISQEVTKNGQPLTGNDLKKRDEAVKKQIEEIQAGKKPKGGGRSLNAGEVLKVAKLANERRIEVGGRPTIVFDVVDDAHANTHSIEEKFVAAMTGTVSIDEATGNLQDINVRGVRDVKVGGGLVANVHKGFAFHLVIAPVGDGVWLVKLAEGKGEARIGLFVKKAGDFRQETEGCKVYDVSAGQADDKIKGAAK